MALAKYVQTLLGSFSWSCKGTTSIKEDSVEEEVIAQNLKSHLTARDKEVASVGVDTRHAKANRTFCLKCKAMAYFARVIEHVAQALLVSRARIRL